MGWGGGGGLKISFAFDCLSIIFVCVETSLVLVSLFVILVTFLETWLGMERGGGAWPPFNVFPGILILC